ncbi:NDR1/HIN1-like protein 1 [Rhodamnia argentea]|uniref:NDR1/HIN1-like protein 1 n=1 Tax=Rhodamnia argentea TaxID=178133 RepID=A0A8B8PY62_9MYRT|nr:NDR1/HIN1-like protein 1 [Rhodamnia argentea]
MCSKCKCHQPWWRRLLCRRRLLIITSTILIVVLTTATATVTAWAVLRPRKPSITLQDITISAFNVSIASDNQTYLLSSTFQVTVSSRNPFGNRHSILYDGLRIHMSYHDQQITPATRLPPTYEGRGGVDVWSPFVCGVSVPIAPYNALALKQDQSDGFVIMKVKLQGHVRWRPGFFTFGGFISVDCPAYIPTGSENRGVPLGFNAVKYRLMQSCSVSL